MIKRYLEFIKEDFNGFNTLGEWIESLSDDPYIINIVSRYTNEIDPDIEILNAVNLLDPKTQMEIKGQIERYLEYGIEDKEPEVLVSTETDELLESTEISASGR